jgi:hypothetical protein
MMKALLALAILASSAFAANAEELAKELQNVITRRKP